MRNRKAILRRVGIACLFAIAASATLGYIAFPDASTMSGHKVSPSSVSDRIVRTIYATEASLDSVVDALTAPDVEPGEKLQGVLTKCSEFLNGPSIYISQWMRIGAEVRALEMREGTALRLEARNVRSLLQKARQRSDENFKKGMELCKWVTAPAAHGNGEGVKSAALPAQ